MSYSLLSSHLPALGGKVQEEMHLVEWLIAPMDEQMLIS